MSSYDSMTPEMVLKTAKTEKSYRVLRGVYSLLKRDYDPSDSLAVLVGLALSEYGFECEVIRDTVTAISEGVKFSVTVADVECVDKLNCAKIHS